MTKEKISKVLDDLIVDLGGDAEVGEAMVVFYNKSKAYSLHRAENNSRDVLTKLYPGRVTPLDEWEDIEDLDDMIECLPAEEVVRRGGIPKILNNE